jgi:hypothetical protein
LEGGPFGLHKEALTFKGPTAKQTSTVHAIGVQKNCLQIRQIFGEPFVGRSANLENSLRNPYMGRSAEEGLEKL